MVLIDTGKLITSEITSTNLVPTLINIIKQLPKYMNLNMITMKNRRAMVSKYQISLQISLSIHFVGRLVRFSNANYAVISTQIKVNFQPQS
jgi:hypothetical protein